MPATDAGRIRLFLGGDVMTGRGIDQVLPHPGDPRIHEPWVSSALTYVELAEQAHGPIPKPVDFGYPWGEALASLEQAAPDLRIVNLETAVTRRGEPWPGKGIHYRMNPANAPCLAAAAIDCCALANNHVLDWGRAGLLDTLESLRLLNIGSAGAGADADRAAAPAVFGLGARGRVLVFSLGHPDSGVPPDWAAGPGTPGVDLLPDWSAAGVRRLAGRVRALKRPGDLVLVSLHWGGNWGYEVAAAHRAFAHALIDEAGVDLVHGHSSHHPRGIEVHGGRLILYGCGDLINDYESIGGHEAFRGDLSLLYLADLSVGSGRLLGLDMVPMQMRRFRLHHASAGDARWLAGVLDRESRRLGAAVEAQEDGALRLVF